MNIDPKHIDKKRTKIVGKLGKDQIVQLMTTGGLVMVCKANKTGELLGMASHQGLAQLIARRSHPEIQWTDLAKGDFISEDQVRDILPKWELITNQLRKRQGL